MKWLLLIGMILLTSPVYAEAEWVRGAGSFESIYCLLTGCTITGNLIVDGNLTVEGNFVNVTVVDYNVTGSLDVNGPVTATNFSGDLFWGNLSQYPAACSAGDFVSGVGDTLTCGTPGGNTHVAGDPPYLYNDSTTMFFNETKLNETIDARENDTNTHVNGSPPWLSNDSTTMYFNETHFNTSVTGLQFWQASANANDIYYGDGSTNDFYVGIGDTTPNANLHIYNDATSNLILSTAVTTTTDAQLRFLSASGQIANICMDDSTNEIYFKHSTTATCTTGTDVFAMTASGLELGERLYHDRARTISVGLTPSVSSTNFWLSRFAGSSINFFNSGIDGQTLYFICINGLTTITDGGGMNLAGGSDFVCTTDSTITLIHHASEWYELSRSVN